MSTGADLVRDLIRDQARAQRSPLLLAALAAAAVSVAAAALLGVSGWFLTGAALAGLAGPVVAHAFNYLVPSAVIRLLAILRTGLRYVERVSGHQAALNALAGLRPALFRGLAASSPSPLLRAASGEVAARLVQDVDAIQSAYVRRSAPWAAVGAMAAGLALSAVAGWPQALIALSAVAASLILSRLLARHLAQAAAREIQVALGALKAEVSALEQAAPELRAYGAGQWALDQVAARAADLDAAHLSLARAAGWLFVAQLAVTALGVASALLVSIGGDAPAAAMAALAVIAAVEGAGAYAEAQRQDGAVSAAIDRLGALIEPVQASASAGWPSPVLRLAGLDRVLQPGDRLVITGPSGCGKTSLIERLLGLRTPVRGEWASGDIDVADLDPALARGLFAYAAQDARFISGTVRQNLHLAAPPAADAGLWRALEDAALADRFRAAQGLDTRLDDDALGLSGGERRRLALARAYLKAAPWLILDEPTESLDPETEREVLEGLERRLAATGQGLIVISHREAARIMAPAAVRGRGVSLALKPAAPEPV